MTGLGVLARSPEGPATFCAGDRTGRRGRPRHAGVIRVSGPPWVVLCGLRGVVQGKTRLQAPGAHKNPAPPGSRPPRPPQLLSVRKDRPVGIYALDPRGGGAGLPRGGVECFGRC